MSKFLQEREQLLLAVEMATRNARPSTIVALTLMEMKKARNVYVDVNGMLVQGKTPSNLELFMSNKKNILACSYFSVCYLKYLKNGSSRGMAVIKAYDKTFERFHRDNSPVVSFDRAYLITQELHRDDKYHLVTCGKCNSRYMSLKDMLQNDHKHCPICQLLSPNAALSPAPSVTIVEKAVKTASL